MHRRSRSLAWLFVALALVGLAGCAIGPSGTKSESPAGRSIESPLSSEPAMMLPGGPPLVEVYRGTELSPVLIGYCLRVEEPGLVNEYWLLAEGVDFPITIDPADVVVLKPIDDPGVTDPATLCERYGLLFPVLWQASYPPPTGTRCP